MRKAFMIVCAAAGLLAMSNLAAAYCMNTENDEEIAEGRLTSDRFKDPAGRPITAYILRPPTAVCLEGPDRSDHVKSARSIQVFSSDDVVHRSIRRFVGKTVLLRGRPFAAQTGHHFAPIVMDISEIDSH